jgi:hypothetical protein
MIVGLVGLLLSLLLWERWGPGHSGAGTGLPRIRPMHRRRADAAPTRRAAAR